MNFTQRDNVFNQNSPFQVKKNGFDLSYEYLSSWDMGKLYPFPAKELYPNDTLRSQIQWKMILETLKKPIYSDISIKFKDYGVAYRNLWKHWRNFYTRGRKGNFRSKLPVVNINVKSNVKGSLFDYLGFPVAYDYYISDGKLWMKKSKQAIESQWGRSPIYVSAFPFLAYDFIYFWNFINSEIQENIIYNIQDNLNNHTSLSNSQNEIILTDFQTDENNLFAYESKDFYSYSGDLPIYYRCLKNTPISFSNVAPDSYSFKNSFNFEYGLNDRYTFQSSLINNITKVETPLGFSFAADTTVKDSAGFIKQNIFGYRYAAYSNHDIINIGFLYNVNWERDYFTSAHLKKQLGDPIAFPMESSLSFNIPQYTQFGRTNDTEIMTDGTTNTALSRYNKIVSSSFFMNDLRLIGALSMLQEGALMSPKTFEYGSYLEFFFGKSPNTRDLQQPYYIGGFNSTFYTQEVVQQSGSTGNTNNLGDYAGKGSSIDDGYIDNYTHSEIGLEMLVMYIVPRKTLQSSQGINRMWLRQDSYDYYNPVFAHLGFQEIQKQELYTTGDASVRQEPFGYTMSWNELRYMSDVVTSDMRDTLNIWHLGRYYDELPKLNSDYLLCRPSKRIFDIVSADTPVITGRVNIITAAYRDLPELGIPELFDHRY